MALAKEHWTWEHATLLRIDRERTNGIIGFTEEEIDRNSFGMSRRVERIFGFELQDHYQEAYHKRIRELLNQDKVVLVIRQHHETYDV